MASAHISAANKSTISPIIAGALFFIFGFVTWLNGVLIPYLKIACQLNNLQSYLVTTAFYIAYLVMAWPSSVVLRVLGFKKGMVAGLLVIGFGALIFIPAALTRQYWVFLTGLFVQGTGLAILQSASNPYITIPGPEERTAKMGIAGAAVISLFYGYLTDLSSNRTAYLILLPIYAFILFYAGTGHSMGRRVKAKPIPGMV